VILKSRLDVKRLVTVSFGMTIYVILVVGKANLSPNGEHFDLNDSARTGRLADIPNQFTTSNVHDTYVNFSVT
jgi:hypothetical protein